jgi:hypothetical protein
MAIWPPHRKRTVSRHHVSCRLYFDAAMVEKVGKTLVFCTRKGAWSRGFAATSLVKSPRTIPFRRLPNSYPRAM